MRAAQGAAHQREIIKRARAGTGLSRRASARYRAHPERAPRSCLSFPSLGGQKLGERSQEAVHLGSRVVVDQAHPQYSAQEFDSHSFGEVERVKISVPGEDAAIAQKRGQFGRRAFLETEGDGGAAFMEALRISDAEKAQAG